MFNRVLNAHCNEASGVVKLNELVELLNAESVQSWTEAYLGLVSQYGFEQTVYGVLPDRTTPLENAFLRSNYSTAWRDKYDTEKFHYIDPTVSHCLQSSLPYFWTADAFKGKQQQAFYEEACSYDIRQGVTMPIHGANGEFGVISFVTDRLSVKEFKSGLDRFLPDLALLRDYIFESSLKFAGNPSDDENTVLLTKRERECLQWAMVGKSTWDIAQILNCSEATVNFHFANLRRKFKVNSRQQVVIRAIHSGLIS